jgi:hydroxymethylpyrimidine/phosphomethylpyrimidine kinase
VPDPPVALTIAGSDSGGGAGMQADLRTFAALGVHGTCALTAVTAQSTFGVDGVHLVPSPFVDAQISSVLSDMEVGAVKTGMLGTAETVSLVAARAGRGELPNLVVDPVMVSSSGERLLDPDAETAYREELLPFARLVTPNLAEAAVLVGREPGDLGEMESAAREIRSLGPSFVLLKGGHLRGSASPDVLFDGREVSVLRSHRVETANDHGSGCTLSAAVAAGLAAGSDLPAAVGAAKEFVTAALRASASWTLGRGHGPLDQLWSHRGAPGERLP